MCIRDSQISIYPLKIILIEHSMYAILFVLIIDTPILKYNYISCYHKIVFALIFNVLSIWREQQQQFILCYILSIIICLLNFQNLIKMLAKSVRCGKYKMFVL